MKVLLSFDVEEFDIPLEYGQPVTQEEMLQVSADGFQRVLDLLDALKISATCFTTAVFAMGRPEQVKRLVQRHELASHGYSHSQFAEEDLLRSREVLCSLGGVPVHGFRRPRFAPTSRHAIAAAGYRYNSSENPIWLPGRYQNFFKPRLPYLVENQWQIPISASPIIRFPFFWLGFKNFPLGIYKAMSQWTLRHDGVINLVFHPWEFCRLDRYRLPLVIRRLDGEFLLERLKIYLQWLAAQAEFITFNEFVNLQSKS